MEIKDSQKRLWADAYAEARRTWGWSPTQSRDFANSVVAGY